MLRGIPQRRNSWRQLASPLTHYFTLSMKFWDVGSLPLNFLSVNHKKVEDDLKEHHPDS